jgi:uncharacterized protein YjbJ (UPF0337 family)
MTFNDYTKNGKWLEIKGEVQKAWGKLTDDDLDKTKGDMKAISGLIQQRYGSAQKGYDEKLTGIFKQFDAKKEQAIADTKKALKN